MGMINSASQDQKTRGGEGAGTIPSPWQALKWGSIPLPVFTDVPPEANLGTGFKRK